MKLCGRFTWHLYCSLGITALRFGLQPNSTSVNDAALHVSSGIDRPVWRTVYTAHVWKPSVLRPFKDKRWTIWVCAVSASRSVTFENPFSIAVRVHKRTGQSEPLRGRITQHSESLLSAAIKDLPTIPLTTRSSLLTSNKESRELCGLFYRQVALGTSWILTFKHHIFGDLVCRLPSKSPPPLSLPSPVNTAAG